MLESLAIDARIPLAADTLALGETLALGSDSLACVDDEFAFVAVLLESREASLAFSDGAPAALSSVRGVASTALAETSRAMAVGDIQLKLCAA